MAGGKIILTIGDKWENDFDKWGYYFGRWENHFGRQPNPKGRHVPSDDNDEDLHDDVHVNASKVMEGLTKSTLPFSDFYVLWISVMVVYF